MNTILILGYTGLIIGLFLFFYGWFGPIKNIGTSIWLEIVGFFLIISSLIVIL